MQRAEARQQVLPAAVESNTGEDSQRAQEHEPPLADSQAADFPVSEAAAEVPSITRAHAQVVRV